CYLMILLKTRLGFDDTLDAFGIHGIGGIVGAIFLTFFIRESWMAEANAAVSGWSTLDQLGVQALAVVIAIAYSAVGTFIILFVLNKFTKIRSSEEGEMKGLDSFYHGERGYGMINPS
ncbi:MAG TPA: ammonia channel protein, partial [Chryseosolibacter sp.]